jgi:hypothetical protein
MGPKLSRFGGSPHARLPNAARTLCLGAVAQELPLHTEMVKNGSLFFMDAGEGVFAVTASHVVEECLNDTRLPMFVQCLIGGHGPGGTAYIYLGDRVIAAHPGMGTKPVFPSRSSERNSRVSLGKKTCRRILILAA